VAYNNFYQPYPGYQQPGYYPPPVPDQLAQLRQQQIQQQFQQPTPPVQQAQVMQNSQPASSGVNWVQGEEGAKAYMVAPGNSVILMDSEGMTFYMKAVDASGMPQPLRIFDYTERTTANRGPIAAAPTPVMDYVTRAEFEALETRLEALANKPCKCSEKPERKTKPKEEPVDE